MTEEDPLNVLFVRSDDVSKELLAQILKPFVRLDEQGGIFPLASFYAESNKNKLLIILLSRKASALKLAVEEAASPAEIRKFVDMPEGSIRPTLRVLVDDRLADEDGGKYKIISPAIQRCAELLSSKKTTVTLTRTKKQNNSPGNKLSIRKITEDFIQEGKLNDWKTAREIYGLVLQRRPGTKYNVLYKVLLDLVPTKLARELKEGTWVYRRSK